MIKVCTKCGKELPATEEYFQKHRESKDGLNWWCKRCCSEYKKKYYKDNLKRINHDKKEYHNANSQRINQRRRELHLNNKQTVIDHYGHSCKICGETRLAFLGLDHIDDNGVEDRKTNGTGGGIYERLIRENFPPGYQVLCHNHNMKKEISRKRSLYVNTKGAIHERKYFAKLKEEVINHYGGKCSCPGCPVTDIDMLSMDHIKGGGTKQRKEEGITDGHSLYHKLKNENYPPGFRVLCMNCNLGRFINGGTCPHDEGDSMI